MSVPASATSNTQTDARQPINSLTSLRIIAAMLVFVTHFVEHFDLSHNIPGFGDMPIRTALILLGDVGVSVFFVLRSV